MEAHQDDSCELFISYTHADNADGWITALVKSIEDEFQAFAGRPLRRFFDIRSLNTWSDWELHILKGLKTARVMLAVLSPAYFGSRFCRKEWRIFTEHEVRRAMLEQHGIANLYYVTVPGLLGQGMPDPAVASWIREINRRQTDSVCDARPWREGGLKALQSLDVRHRIARLCKLIDDRIQLADHKALSFSNVPSFNPNFVGRIEDLRKLRHTLEEQPVGAVVGVQGIGGIGKTELAFAYAHAYADVYPGGRYLVEAEGLTDLREALVRLVDRSGGRISLTPDQRVDLDRAAALVRDQIVRQGRSLLILDNVDQPDLLTPRQIDRALPDRAALHTLVTTREDPSRLRDVTCLTVDALEVEDALRLLERHRPFDDDEMKVALRIVNTVGCHPQACEIIGVYLGMKQQESVTYAEYIQWLERDVIGALNLEGTDIRVALRRNAVPLIDKLLAPTLDQLTPVERRTLEYAALLPPDKVPLPWIRELLVADMPEALTAPEPGRPDPWKRVVSHLNGLRLLTVADGDVRATVARMHRLAQAVVQAATADPREAREQVRRQALGRAKVLQYGNIPANLVWEVYALAAVADLFSIDNNFEAALLSVATTRPLRLLGDRSEAWRLAIRAAKLFEHLAPAMPDDKRPRHNLATSLMILGDLERDVGRLGAARGHYQQSHDIFVSLAAAMPNDMEVRRNLALSLQQLGDLVLDTDPDGAARGHYQQSHDIFASLAAAMPDDMEVRRGLALSLQKLGDLEYAAGRTDAAHGHYQRCLGIQESLAMAMPDDIDNRRDLATSLQQLGDLELEAIRVKAAREYYQRNLDIRESLAAEMPGDKLACSHLSMSLQRLGDLERNAGRAGAARSHYLRCHDICASVAAEMPDNVAFRHALASSLRALGDLDLDAGQVDAARKHFQQSHDILASLAAAMPDAIHAQLDLACSLQRLGDVECDAGQLGAACAHYQQRLDFIESLGATMPNNTLVWGDLAAGYFTFYQFHKSVGQQTQAFNALRRCREILLSMRERGMSLDPQAAQLLAQLNRHFGAG